MSFVHLHVHSPFSFLDGASTMDALIRQAAEMNMPALALTDHNNVCGAVRWHKTARDAGIQPIQGAEITLTGGYRLILLAQDAQGYASLCRVLSEAHLGHERGQPAADRAILARYPQGLIALSGCHKGEIPSLLLRKRHRDAAAAARSYLDIYGRDHFFIELMDLRLPYSKRLNARLADLAAHLQLDIVATNDVRYAKRTNFALHDVLTCVRTGTGLDDLHPDRPLNAEQYLRSPTEMTSLFTAYPAALDATRRIAERCQPVLDLEQDLFPAFPVPQGQTALGILRELVHQGARERYGRITDPIAKRLQHELHIIGSLGVEDYFLAVWDVARYARKQGIRYAGRGSAADSAVAYCLYITDVDAIGRNLLFERFLSLERAQKPDIDIDFQADRRDEVADYVYQRYGPDHVASVCTYHTYHARSAIRDFGKALGLPPREIDRLAKAFPHIPADAVRSALDRFPETRDSGLSGQAHKYALLWELCEQAAGFPRHIGTHLGGLVISRRPLQEVTPLQRAAKGVVITQFDKDDVEELGLIKLDLLSLRTLSAVQDAVVDINQRQTLDYRHIPLDDQATYNMLGRGESIGVFQLESPAQRALQPRLNPSHIEDLVASVALIRPGPIKGNMVEPFLARRLGQEPVTYIDPRLRPILEKTYGVVLYQEQVIEIATTIAGFTPGESDRLRRVMTHFRSQKEMDAIGEEFVRKAVANGTPPQTADTIFSYIVGYAGYGFCEAHAAAFSDTAYKTAYLVRHHAAEFYAAILSHQPMGFYPPNTICLAARLRGINILPPDINTSTERFTVENGSIRVSLACIRGMSKPTLTSLLNARQHGGAFRSLTDLTHRARIPRDILTNLILAGACDGLHPNRRQLLWRVADLYIPHGDRQFAFQVQLDMETGSREAETAYWAGIEDFTPIERFLHEYDVLGLNTRRHMMDYLRTELSSRGILGTQDLPDLPTGTRVRVAGIVLRPHRPPTRSGRTVVFVTLEDEQGWIDVTVFEDIYQRDGRAIFTHPALVVDGRLERRGQGISVTATRAVPLPLRHA